MRRIGVISKIYYTKKSLLNYYKYKSYSTYLKNKEEYHVHDIITFYTAKEEVKNIQLGSLCKINQQDKKIEIIDIDKLLENKNDCIISNMVKSLILEQKKKNVLTDIFLDRENNNMFKSSLKIVGGTINNFTTDLKKDSIPIVKPNVLPGYLGKGIAFHTKNVLIFKIANDKDFKQIFMYILINYEDDLTQKEIIENNTFYKNTELDEMFNSQAKKLLQQFKIKDIIFNNNIKTKVELLNFLSENWIKIRVE